jgi:hypothetical protein
VLFSDMHTLRWVVEREDTLQFDTDGG